MPCGTSSVPISTVFAGDVDAYIAGLTSYRAGNVDAWVIGFAQAAEIAASNAVRLADDIARLDDALLQQLLAYRRSQGLAPESPRADAVVLKILGRLSSDPVVTIDSVAEAHSVSRVAANNALTQLADARILGRSKDHKGRLVCWTADKHLALVALTERSNRVGGGDTANKKPRQGPPVPPGDALGTLREG